jgi:hypothetical protein
VRAGSVRREQRAGSGSRRCPPGSPRRKRRRLVAKAGKGGCACGSECECVARASGGESGSHSGKAHTDMFDRRDMTREREEAAAAGAGPRAPA